MVSKRTTSLASKAPSLVKDGDTKIHRHPDRDEIMEVLALYVLTPPNRRVTLKVLEQELIDTFNIDLPGTGNYVKTFNQRYIIPAVVVEPKWVRQGIIEAGHNLNIPQRKLAIADRLEKRFSMASRDTETKPSDVATLGRASLDALEKAEDSLERYELIPSKKNRSESTNLEVDLAGVLSTLMGSRADQAEMEDKTVDVDGEVN